MDHHDKNGETPTGKPESKHQEKQKDALLEAQRLATERLQQLQYLQADFENFKKQLQKEHVHAVENAEATLIRDLLPTLDDLDAAKDEGTVLIRKTFLKILEHHGVSEIPSAGTPDPLRHEVLMKEPGPEGKIVRVIQKGYLLRSHVLRPAKVTIGEAHGKGKDHRN